jgi:PAS domain S-box-containing protein/putative nucleotidyltransferase with HDIG domain
LNKIKLKLRIFIYFAIAAILPSLLFWIFINAKIDSKLENDYRNTAYNSIQSHIKDVDYFFEKQDKIVSSIAKSYSYIENSTQGISDFLQKQADINEHFLNLYVVNTKGELVTNTGRVMKYTDYTLKIPYQSAIKQQKLVWLEPYNDEISKLKTIGLAVPLYDKNNKLDGVLVANLTYDYIKQVLSSSEFLSSSKIYMLNSKGDIKFTINSDVTQGNASDKGFVLNDVSKDILTLKQGTHDIEDDGISWLCTFSTMNTIDWKIVVLYNAKKIVENVGLLNKDIYTSITILGVAVVLLILFLSIYLSNSISRPLLKLRDGVQELSLGNLDYKISIKGMDEIKIVADTFNQMSDNLNKSTKDIFTRTEELYEKNEYLQEMNAELEASYEQLGATMEQLNESEEKYRKLVNNISDLVIVINTETEIVYVNSSVENIVGYPASQLIGKTLKEIMNSDFNEETLKTSFENDHNEFQFKMKKKYGETLYLECNTRRIIEHEKVVGIQAIARDITQRKLMEDELHSRYNDLKAINEITNAVTKTLNLDVMLDVVVDKVRNAAKALCCTVGLYNEDSGEYTLKAVKGMRLEDKSVVNVDSSKAKMIKLIDNQKHFVIEYKDEDMLPNDYYKMLYREEGARYTLFISLEAHGRDIGLMSTILMTKPSKELIELLASLGNSIALSIDNAKAYENVKYSYLKTVQSLVSTIEAKDMYTESHSIRVAKYATLIAKELNMDKSDLEDIWVAGVLHDIGKIGISDTILNKKDRLTNEEYQLVKQHPTIAYKIISQIGLNQGIMQAVKHHHERYDGTGYPDGLDGENIDLLSCIISVADAFDAITSERSYKQSKSLMEGIEELNECKGTQFSPLVVDVFSKAYYNKKEVVTQIHNDMDIKVS